ncbi:putative hydantoin racemase [Phaeomoniella chlamydospora]|uniref:Putative hydantoin racemase n=1 Tax=Phaeomoniella chlamydospora TaxID=158046 RepID=A0A0G2F2Q0_PHACM|nr:putative hydantoin racemase [Phaeomoniella chlamydospora]
MSSSQPKIPKTATRSKRDPEIESWLKYEVPDLHLGGAGDFHEERRHHHAIFGFHYLPVKKQAPIGSVKFTAIRGPHRTIHIRVFYPRKGERKRQSHDAAALIYFHGGGYTIATVDEFEQGHRILAEESSVIVFVVEYKLAPEWRFHVQLDEYDAVLDWLYSDGGKDRGVNPSRVLGGGDSAGGNMTAAISLRRKEGKKGKKEQMRAQI